MIKKYSVGLGQPIAANGSIDGDTTHESVVFLSGSTGGLGSHLLESLLKDSGVQKVYAYNRPSRGTVKVSERQKETFDDRGLDTSLLASDKLIFVEGDSALDHLGLEAKLYDEVSYIFSTLLSNHG